MSQIYFGKRILLNWQTLTPSSIYPLNRFRYPSSILYAYINYRIYYISNFYLHACFFNWTGSSFKDNIVFGLHHSLETCLHTWHRIQAKQMFRMNEWVKCVFLLTIDVASLLVMLEFLARVTDLPSFNSNRTNKWSTYQFSLFSYQRIFFILNRYYWNRCSSIRCPKQMKQSWCHIYKQMFHGCSFKSVVTMVSILFVCKKILLVIFWTCLKC